MSERSRPLLALYAVTVLLLASFAGGSGLIGVTAAGNHGASLSCVGNSGGATYVTDSGLVALENDPSVTFGQFEDGGEAVTFGGTTVAAAGNAEVRVDETGDSASPCFGHVRATENPLRIDPGGITPITLDTTASGFTYRDPVYSTDESAADLAYSATARVRVTIRSTGLPAGTDLVATDLETDRQLDESAVETDGSVTFVLEAGTRRVDIATVEETATLTPTPTPAPPETQTPTPTSTTTPPDGDPEGDDDDDDDRSDPTPPSTRTPDSTPTPTRTPTVTSVPTSDSPSPATRTVNQSLSPTVTSTETPGGPPTSTETPAPPTTRQTTSTALAGTGTPPSPSVTATGIDPFTPVSVGGVVLLVLVAVGLVALRMSE